LTKLSM